VGELDIASGDATVETGALVIPVIKAVISGEVKVGALLNPGVVAAVGVIEGIPSIVVPMMLSGGEFERDVLADAGAVILGCRPPLHLPA
jgi:hypothetical protein